MVREVYPGVKADLSDDDFNMFKADVIDSFNNWNANVTEWADGLIKNTLVRLKNDLPGPDFGQALADLIAVLKSCGFKAAPTADDLFEEIKKFN